MSRLPERNHPCFHCGLTVETDRFLLAPTEPTNRTGETLEFCCNGCKQAYMLIQREGLGGYYDARTDYASRPEDGSVPEEALYRALEQKIASEDGGIKEGTFLIRGIHCASCVWLNEKILRNIEGVVSVTVQLATSRVHLRWDPARTSLAQLARAVSKVGYRLLPVQEKDNTLLRQASTELLKKMAIAGFFTGNIMLVSIALYAGALSFIDAITKHFFQYVSWVMATPVLIYSASEFYRGAWTAIRNRVLAMDILTAAGISLAYFYSVYVTVTAQGEVFFDAVCFVVFAILIGRFLESRIRLKTWYYTQNLISYIPDFARVVKDRESAIEDWIEDSVFNIVPVEDVKPGDFLVVRNGEALPVDGRLLSESAETDESALTGEFKPRTRSLGEVLTAGSRAAGYAPIALEALTSHKESTLARIMKMAEESLRERPRSERIAETTAAVFIAFVLLGGAATFYYWAFVRGSVPGAILNTLSFLIVACPCALSLSIPTAILVSMQRAFSRGCLIHKAEHLEILAKARQMAFDKTGTITTGHMHVAGVDLPGLEGAGQDTEAERRSAELLRMAAAIQTQTGIQHPIVRAFLESPRDVPVLPGAVGGRTAGEASAAEYADVVYHTGRGVEARSGRTVYHLGSIAWLQELGYDVYDASASHEVVTCVAFGSKGETGAAQLLCVFRLLDTIRPEAVDVVKALNRSMHTELLTGDQAPAAALVCEATGIKAWQASLSPEQKRDRVTAMRRGGVTVMLGDGVNDTVALSAAQVGVTFADASRLALYSADILLLKSDLSLLLFLYRLSRRTRVKIYQNLALSFGYNLLLLPLAFFGHVTPLLGAIFMSLSSITVVSNSLLLMRAGEEGRR